MKTDYDYDQSKTIRNLTVMGNNRYNFQNQAEQRANSAMLMLNRINFDKFLK